jgi:hypothetical protein
VADPFTDKPVTVNGNVEPETVPLVTVPPPTDIDGVNV